jgi:hypothetical protein
MADSVEWTTVALREVRIRGKSFPAKGEEALRPVLRFAPDGRVDVALDADFTSAPHLLSFNVPPLHFYDSFIFLIVNIFYLSNDCFEIILIIIMHLINSGAM